LAPSTAGKITRPISLMVLEVAFSVHRSTRYRSDVAMRFPRIHRDKPFREADALEALKKLLT
jgi:DNA ligase-1